ncbi:divergent polysaccharide deacetylase family protein [Roseomonas sp. F4]
MSRIFARRSLAIFWAVLVLAAGIGVGVLQWLGPPAEPSAMVAEVAPEPPGEPAPAEGRAAEASPAEASVSEPPAPAAPAPTPPAPTAPAPTADARPPAASPPPSPAPIPPAPAAPAPMAEARPPAASPPPPPSPTAAPQAPEPASRAVAPMPAARPEPAATSAAVPPPAAAPGAAPVAPPPPPLTANAAPASQAQPDPQIPPPDPELLERGRHGPLPKLGPENRTSIRAYARPFDREDRRPRIGLIIGNVGLFAQHSEEAIRRLPGAVTLAFSPYALRPEPLLDRARARGMEVLVALPLEPAGFGQDADPGDRALLTGLSVEDNLDRLDWALSRIQGQVGAIGALGRLRGERFAANAELLGTIQAALTNRGLLYIDPRPGAPTPARAFGRTVDLVLDDPSETRGEVERRLVELEALAKRNNAALGLLGNPTPFFTAAILAWAAGLEERGAVLAPVTVMLRRPTSQATR